MSVAALSITPATDPGLGPGMGRDSSIPHLATPSSCGQGTAGRGSWGGASLAGMQ